MEHRPRNREWVKNAAIVFLSVLLVLTFFSNTIMNRSLPEVATQNVSSGTITARVRGTGTVTAVGVQSVKAKETREIRAVMVKIGQEVRAGDVLFVLGQGDATELEAAQEQLRSLQISYQRAAINVPTPNYSYEQRKIDEARRELNAAQNKADEAFKEMLKNLPEEKRGEIERLEDLHDSILHATSVLAELNAAAEEEITRADSAQYEAERQYEALKAELDRRKAAESLASIEVRPRYILLSAVTETEPAAETEPVSETEPFVPLEGTTPAALPSESGTEDGDAPQPDTGESEGSAAADQPPQTEPGTEEPSGTEPGEGSAAVMPTTPAGQWGEIPIEELERMVDEAYRAMIEARLYRATLSFPERDAQSAYLQKLQAEHDAILDSVGPLVITYLSIYKTAIEERDAAADKLAELEYNLAVKQAADAKSQQLSWLDLEDLSQQIEKARQRVAELSGGEQNQILAPVAGTVLTVECAPGDTKLKNDVLATLEVPDMGYTLSFSVTNDQARRLKTGDTGSVANYYWGSQITATLTSIKTDPKNPQTNKILTFELDGDVTPGAELTLSVGQKSSVYDTVVPRSAVRSDANGSFVLIVESRSSPLGNRYTARRVTVETLAEDDVSAAVTGDLNMGDYVITTSNAPVKNGDQVRLSDGS